MVLIVDAGGGTVDVSSYTVLDNAPLEVEELFQPKCQFAHLRLPPSIIDTLRKACYKVENLSQRGPERWSKVIPDITPPSCPALNRD